MLGNQATHRRVPHAVLQCFDLCLPLPLQTLLFQASDGVSGLPLCVHGLAGSLCKYQALPRYLRRDGQIHLYPVSEHLTVAFCAQLCTKRWNK